ncbi:MAG TPA: MlaD family protein [Ignavibacteriaceae bacterium]|nr:MlaD family protein [Ignavibacteriaceae bacterium]
MKNQKKTELKVGITIFFALLVLMLIIAWAKNISISAARTHFDIRFANASGLEVGDNVTVNGVRKGNVDNIRVNGESVIVTVAIESDIKIREDAKFYIGMLDLMGGKKVEIIQGNSGKELDYGKLHTGTYLMDISSAMASMGSLTEDVPKLISKINETLDGINSIVNNQEVRNNLVTSLNNLSTISQDLRILIQNNDKKIESLLTNTNDLVNNSNEFLKKNSKGIESSLQNIEGLLVKADTLISGVTGLLNDTKSGENNLGKLLYDKELYKEIETTVKTLKELTTILNEQLKNEGVNVKAKIKLF